MHTRKLIGLGVLALAVATSPALAQGKGHDKDKGKHGDDRDEQGRVVVVQQPQQVVRDSRGRVVVVQSNGDVRRVPPGLAKKPGGMPPGQYKKMYRTSDGVSAIQQVFPRRGYTIIRTVPAGTSQYVYYRTPNGLVQRAIVSPGTDRLSFSNVPATLLQEILARLY